MSVSRNRVRLKRRGMKDLEFRNSIWTRMEGRASIYGRGDMLRDGEVIV